MSRSLLRRACVCRRSLQVRHVATEAAAPEAGPSSYPFSSQVRVIPTAIPVSSEPLLHRINKHLVRTQGHSEAKHMRLFSRRNPYRALPGSILQVTSYSNAARTSTTSFSGQLIAVKRGGVDTSFRLRALLARTGVEIRYNAASNLIHDIKVIARADKAKGAQRKSGRPALLRARRAKLYFLRDQPDRLANPAGQLKAYEVYERAVAKRKERAAAGQVAGKGRKPAAKVSAPPGA